MFKVKPLQDYKWGCRDMEGGDSSGKDKPSLSSPPNAAGRKGSYRMNTGEKVQTQTWGYAPALIMILFPVMCSKNKGLGAGEEAKEKILEYLLCACSKQEAPQVIPFNAYNLRGQFY